VDVGDEEEAEVDVVEARVAVACALNWDPTTVTRERA